MQMNSDEAHKPVKTRFLWVILLGFLGGFFLWIPHGEFVDPMRSLPAA